MFNANPIGTEFQFLQTGKRSQSDKTEPRRYRQSNSFNSLQTGKRSQSAEKDISLIVGCEVSIPFKRESGAKVRWKIRSLTRSQRCFNSLQTGKRSQRRFLLCMHPISASRLCLPVKVYAKSGKMSNLHDIFREAVLVFKIAD